MNEKSWSLFGMLLGLVISAVGAYLVFTHNKIDFSFFLLLVIVLLGLYMFIGCLNDLIKLRKKNETSTNGNGDLDRESEVQPEQRDTEQAE